MKSVKETGKYQNRIKESLEGIFGTNNVIKEWDVAKNSKENFARNLYSPRIDIAIGPFNTTIEVENNIAEINRAFNKFHRFIESLKSISVTRFEDVNENPRCFIAIEIEKKGSRKHMLGDIVNASSIGKVGIIIPWDEKALNAFNRIKEYLEYIKTVRKTSYGPKNILIIPKKEFKNFLESFHNTD